LNYKGIAMDPIEKKLKSFYQAKKQEDEKSIPDFDAFWYELQKAKTIKQPHLFLRIAASVAIVATTALLYYFYTFNQPSKEMQGISKIKLDQPLPSQVLLDQSLDVEYIWKWKAPTDQLLEDANKLINTDINKKF